MTREDVALRFSLCVKMYDFVCGSILGVKQPAQRKLTKLTVEDEVREKTWEKEQVIEKETGEKR